MDPPSVLADAQAEWTHLLPQLRRGNSALASGRADRASIRSTSQQLLGLVADRAPGGRSPELVQAAAENDSTQTSRELSGGFAAVADASLAVRGRSESSTPAPGPSCLEASMARARETRGWAIGAGGLSRMLSSATVMVRDHRSRSAAATSTSGAVALGARAAENGLGVCPSSPQEPSNSAATSTLPTRWMHPVTVWRLDQSGMYAQYVPADPVSQTLRSLIKPRFAIPHAPPDPSGSQTRLMS